MSMRNETHGPSIGSYLIGFILAVFFTLGSFVPVMYGMMESWAISTKVAYLIGMAIIQIIVQIVFFLHLGSDPDAKWNFSALWFAAICIFIIIGGTWWAISHLNYNMMGGSGRVIEPEISSQDDSSVSEQFSNKNISVRKQSEKILGSELLMEQVPSIQTPVDQVPSSKMPMEQVPNMHRPVDQVPGSEMLMEQAPNIHSPVDQVPGSEILMEQVPNMHRPVDQVPGSEMFMEQAPNMHRPVDQVPGSEMLMEQAPNMHSPIE
ncbi:cytochrome o ubiquinol oxidase operon protein cyoD [Bartonella fuyuanensis]|uniref:Cytochrome bo(3) ubiquinol oxidase subunit 4 n=1 Tax=Bartonella fuyuanensis TaxID=1460968 RepID=A0A840DWH2_9HYPH|nr:cytochrome o ubiquinol oxidase subunit IV [Bartonella fuyuanensis]MBB4076003.1 cytochrome o ubiquinol oxidase operon protein cyoD [Bartonella fuyuanensis]